MKKTNFFKTNNGDYIHINAIQAITPIRGKDLYSSENDLSFLGNQTIKLFSDQDKRLYFGGSNLENNSWYWERGKVRYPHKTYAYAIHTSIPNGGINYSHLVFVIKPDEMEELLTYIQ